MELLTCCLLPRFVMTVKFITPFPSRSLSRPVSASPSSARFLRKPGPRTAESHQAVFLSTFLDSAEESVMILASSFSNSASASSVGPRCSWVDKTTTGSGDGARSSFCGAQMSHSQWIVGLSQAVAYRRVLTSRIAILILLLLRPFTFIITVVTTIVTSRHLFQIVS